MPFYFSAFEHSFISFMPNEDKGISVHPAHFFYLFQILSPCLTTVKVCLAELNGKQFFINKLPIISNNYKLQFLDIKTYDFSIKLIPIAKLKRINNIIFLIIPKEPPDSILEFEV